MIGSTYIPQRWGDVETSKVKPDVIGIQATILKTIVQTVDTLITDDVIIRGIEFLCKDANFGDSITISVVDVDAVYAPAGTVLSTPVNNYVLSANNHVISYDSVVPQKMLGGLYIRLIYTSTGTTTDVGIGMNLLLLKLLI